jgi:hypothetical protein
VSDPVSVTATVDFLPAHYHERSRKRRTDLWRLFVVGLLGGVIACTALAAHQIHRQAQTELVAVESLKGNSDSTSVKIADLQARLKPLRADAERLTYLRHPWPKTQILAAVVQPLPDSIMLTRLHIVRESTEKPGLGQTPARTQAAPGAATKEPLPISDLQRLRADNDQLKCVVLLSGSVSEPSDLYEYLGRLGDQGLFSRVELGPVERSGGDQRVARFTARLTVRPGYGQSGGPAPAAARAGSDAVARTNRNGGAP